MLSLLLELLFYGAVGADGRLAFARWGRSPVALPGERLGPQRAQLAHR